MDTRDDGPVDHPDGKRAARVLGAIAVLGGACALIAGCAAGQPGRGAPRAGRPGGAPPAGRAARSSPPSPPSPAAHPRPPSASPAAPGPTERHGANGAGTSAGCAAWPAGSHAGMLSVTSSGNGKTYCVRAGDTVRLILAGALPQGAGLGPPVLSGEALAPARHPRYVTRAYVASYAAVRPGRSELSAVRMPCRGMQPMRTAPAPAAAGTGPAVAGTGPAVAGIAPAVVDTAPGVEGTALAVVDTAPDAIGAASLAPGTASGTPGAGQAALTALVSGMSRAGGVPVGPQCSKPTTFRVVIVVR